MSRTSRIWLVTAAVVVVALVAGVLWLGGDDDGDPVAVDPWPDRAGDVADGGGVRLLLSQGRAGAAEPVAVVAGEPLTAAQIDAIVRRLNPFAAEPDDQQAFNRPAESLPPPRSGETVDTPFGEPDATAPDVVDGPLEVVRVQPDGDVDVAPFVTITFNQPMIPVATLDQLDAIDVPVQVSPDVPGRWRWLGTRTLRFDYDGDLGIDRLPMATEYMVTIPAGLTSETGGVLADDASFTFTTPPPNVVSLSPIHDSLPLEPVWVAVFDQRIDPERVLDSISVRAGNSDVALRVATDDEITDDDNASRTWAQAYPASGETSGLDGRVLAFTPAERLPTDKAVTITVGPGTPSAEGPRTTTEADTFRGRTYGRFRLVDTQCGWDEDECRPGDPFRLRFSNPIDPASFDPDRITIEPAVAMRVGAYGDTIEIAADTAGNTDYRVRIPAGMPDIFGQPLAADVVERFSVGDARDQLAWAGSHVAIVDPSAPTPGVNVQVVNHERLHVRAFAVTPADWSRFERFRDSAWEDKLTTPPGQEVFDATIDTDAPTGRRTEVTVSLADAFAAASDGQLVVLVESVRDYDPRDDEFYENRPIVLWVQDTTLGVDAFADDEQLVVWTTDLRDGSPVGGATITLGSTTSKTNPDGLVTMPLPSQGEQWLTAEAGDELTMLRADHSGTWRRETGRDITRWYVVDDRGIYRPGETVRIKGWVRHIALSDDASISRLPAGSRAAYQAYDSFGNELADGTVILDGAGGFDLSFPIPAGANLGEAWIEFQSTAGGISSSDGHSFRIDEFRRPDFEVVARAESAEPHRFTQPVTTAATASYFAGGPLPDAPVTWQVSSRSTTYSPPNHSEFTFGIWQPWWGGPVDFDEGFYGGVEYADVGGYAGDGAYEEDYFPPGPGFGDTEVERFEGRTGADGTHYLRLDFAGAAPDQPLVVSANAAVEDVNRQRFASTTDLLVHSGELYVGLRSERTFVREGEPLVIQAILTDIDGTPVTGRDLVVTAARIEQQWTADGWEETEVDPQECRVASSAEAVNCSFTTETGGQYRISSTVTDDAGGQNRTELTRWVSGGDAIPSRSVDQEQLTLIPDAETYAPGDTAEILVAAPFETGTGLVTVTGNGISSTETFELTGASAVIRVPISEASIPGIGVQVDVAGAAPRTRDDGTADDTLPARPAFATGAIGLDVPPGTRTLTVTPTPRTAALEPGADTAVDLVVTDATGAPVDGAQALVVVVDEAVLALTGYTLRDPLALFYAQGGTYLRSEYSRRNIQLANPETLGGEGPSPTATFGNGGDDLGYTSGDGADTAGGGTVSTSRDAMDDSGEAEEAAEPMAPGAQTDDKRSGTPIAERANFDALAVFAPAVTTDADGRATVEVPLPDNLTRYRVMAVAVAGDDRFGSGESSITARLPLSVRPSAPRFLNFGDTFELPVVVQNRTDQDLPVSVVIESTNLDVDGDTSTDPSRTGQLVTVPANDRVEVRFPAAADAAGTARFRATVSSGDAADSATIELPVYTPTTTEAFATYGVVDDDGAVSQPTLTPAGVVPGFGGLEITTSSTSLQTLTDAVIYLSEYPYESADALAARVLSISALRDVYDAFDVDGVPSAAELDAIVVSDLERLAALQNDDGGWPVWRRYAESVPWYSIQAAHAFVAARSAGYTVDADAMEQARLYLRTIEQHIPSDYGEQHEHLLRAYAVHVRDLDGDRDPAEALELYGNDDLPLDATVWLWPVLDDAGAAAEIRRHLDNVVVETPSAATFSTGIDESAHLVLASDRRTDGVVLEAMIRMTPDDDLIPKVVQGLIGNQRQGRWDNVQENAFILLALKRYFDTYEDVEPDFVARVWLGDGQAARHDFEGYSTDFQRSTVPMRELLDPAGGADPDIVVAKSGPGRLYYRLGLDYAPASLALDARDAGFVVERSYEAVGDAGDVTRDADGTWRIRAGAEVRVRLSMVADSRRVNMALVDHLPAGLEIVNSDLANAPAVLPEEIEGEYDDEYGYGDGFVTSRFDDWWYPWTWRWFDHQNLRDDRAEAFSAWLPAGTYDWSYVARATTPGEFVVPPAKAEEIYTPEVFGRTATDRVVVAG